MTTASTSASRIRPYRVDVPASQVDDLAARVGRTRLPNVPEGVPEHGVPLATISGLVDRWRDRFDWRAVEARINAFPQVLRTAYDGTRLFAVHLEASGASRDALPVVLLHGWADTVLSQLAVAGRVAAAGHPVVVPSLPGFAFSDQPPGAATASASASAVHDLMTDLGYTRYVVHGGDWGGAVAHALMTEHPDSVAAAHLVDIPFYLHFLTERDALEPEERAFLDAADARQEEPQYFRVQAERPLTLAYGMADSPVALLSWLVNLYTAWTDQPLDADAVLAQASLYWLTNTFHSSVRFYSEGTDVWDDGEAGDDPDAGEDAGREEGAAWGEDWGSGGDPIPTAFAIHPADIVVPTRSYAERYFDVARFTVMPAGGHFAAMDRPDALADDLLEFLAGRDG